MICGAGDAQCCLNGEVEQVSTDLQDQFHEFVEHVDRRLLQLEQSLSELFERMEVVEESVEEGEAFEDEIENESPPKKLYKSYT